MNEIHGKMIDNISNDKKTEVEKTRKHFYHLRQKLKLKLKQYKITRKAHITLSTLADSNVN